MGEEQEIQNYLTAENLKAVQDSVGQDHCGRNVLSEGLTQKVGLDSVRQECALCCQGKVHRKTPRIVSKLRKREGKVYQEGKCLSTWSRRVL